MYSQEESEKEESKSKSFLLEIFIKPAVIGFVLGTAHLLTITLLRRKFG